MTSQWLLPKAPLFLDRREAGRELAAALAALDLGDAIVVGLARGGVVVAAEVASELALPLDLVAVRKVGHPGQPEYAVGAVAPGDGVYLRDVDGLEEGERIAAVERAKRAAAELDRRLHERNPALELAGRTAVLVDDGLATGATMIAAIRWARARGAGRIVAAVPVGASETIDVVRRENAEVVCLHAMTEFFAVGTWYELFDPVEDEEVLQLLDAAGRPVRG
jgi:putative phosphoribosyl transferase